MKASVVFFGSGGFAVPALSLLARNFRLPQVVTLPPRSAGRSQKLSPTPIAEAATELGLPLHLLEDRNTVHEIIAPHQPDLAVVIDFGVLLPPPLLAIPRLGFFNLHPSLLPRWRGAAPIPRAILAGDPGTGISVLQVTEELDAGPVVAQRALPLLPEDTAGALHERLAEIGAHLLLESLQQVLAGETVFTEQDPLSATYASKIQPAEERIDWRQPAVAVRRQIHALASRPGAWCQIEGKRIRLLEAVETAQGGPPGTVLDDQLTVACGSGSVRILMAQRPGRKPLNSADLLRGFAIAPGTIFDLA